MGSVARLLVHLQGDGAAVLVHRAPLEDVRPRPLRTPQAAGHWQAAGKLEDCALEDARPLRTPQDAVLLVAWAALHAATESCWRTPRAAGACDAVNRAAAITRASSPMRRRRR